MDAQTRIDLAEVRASGILMHISSLPGNTGIGTMGKNAFAFVDILCETNQRYWQILPICPTGYGNSPYQSFSSFAGNPYFIDLDLLSEQGLLDLSDYNELDWGKDPSKVDYSLLYKNRNLVFEKVYNNFRKNIPDDFPVFCHENLSWLEDYSLFMAIKDAYQGKPFSSWDDDIRKREKDALAQWEKRCKDRTEYYKMLQYIFYKQWNDLKRYANSKGISIIGDIPIYVSGDSADVWSDPKEFFIDENLCPIEVSGCPPDIFSQEGQLWGNPLYDWNYMKQNGFKWWKTRLEKSLEIYDVLRVDHFLGFDAYYCIPFGSENAKNGRWQKGPGIEFWESMKIQLENLPIIAEDLGVLSDSAKNMLKESGFPGMKVLQFAFNSNEKSDYLPYNYNKNSVVYIGTHDNNTLLGWVSEMNEDDLKYLMEYLRVDNLEKISEEMISLALSSVSNTCILTMQDLLGLGSDGRMNIPSTSDNNWCFRATEEQLLNLNKDKISHYVEIYGRKNKNYSG